MSMHHPVDEYQDIRVTEVGRQEGRQEGIIEVARNLLRKKMSYDDVVDATGLPLDEIKQLAADIS